MIDFGALMIDRVLLLAVLFGLLLVGGAVVIAVNPQSALLNPDLNGWAARAVLVGVTSGAWLCWLAGWQAAVGAAPGMLLLRLRVRGPTGEGKPSVVAAVSRNGLTIVGDSFALFGNSTDIDAVLAIAGAVVYWVTGVTISWSPTRQGIHDRLACGTYVVRRAPTKPQSSAPAPS
jgi:hypothetical protein